MVDISFWCHFARFCLTNQNMHYVFVGCLNIHEFGQIGQIGISGKTSEIFSMTQFSEFFSKQLFTYYYSYSRGEAGVSV